MGSASSTLLCNAVDEYFWPWQRWPEFARWQAPENAMVVVPLAGMTDWKLGLPLDAEELVLMELLRLALATAKPDPQRLTVVPPLRFVFGAGPDCAFGADPDETHQFITEVVQSIAASGFRRVLLYNASPWNEELTAAAARDLRISEKLQMFRINLTGLGLDFATGDPTGQDRLKSIVQAIASDDANHATEMLGPATDRLVRLLAEIDQWPVLPHDGEIPRPPLPPES